MRFKELWNSKESWGSNESTFDNIQVTASIINVHAVLLTIPTLNTLCSSQNLDISKVADK